MEPLLLQADCFYRFADCSFIFDTERIFSSEMCVFSAKLRCNKTILIENVAIAIANPPKKTTTQWSHTHSQPIDRPPTKKNIQRCLLLASLRVVFCVFSWVLFWARFSLHCCHPFARSIWSWMRSHVTTHMCICICVFVRGAHSFFPALFLSRTFLRHTHTSFCSFYHHFVFFFVCASFTHQPQLVSKRSERDSAKQMRA